MAVRYRIQRIGGGQILEIAETALPFFPGYVVVGTVGVPSHAIPAITVIHGADADAIRPPSAGAVVWYGTVAPNNGDPDVDVFIPVTSFGG